MNKRLIFTIVLLLSSCASMAFAYDNTITHPSLTEAAIKKSKLSNYLIYNVGISQGLRERYKGIPIRELIKEGSNHEDSWFRGFNHFYNPLNNEGLDDVRMLGNVVPLPFWGNPNRAWAMGKTEDGTILDMCPPGDHPSSNSCNDYSWRRARATYYQALTSPSISDRELKFIQFYEKLGRVVHLLEDMGVPAHTRNDMFGHLNAAKLTESGRMGTLLGY